MFLHKSSSFNVDSKFVHGRILLDGYKATTVLNAIQTNLFSNANIED